MSKEIIISSCVIIAILILDIWIGNFIDSKMEHEISLLGDLRVCIENNDYKVAKEKVKEVDNYWNKSEEVLSFYLEHDELEKVSTELASLKVYIEMQNDDALESVDKMQFIIRHIEEKNDLKIKNIF